ncbi:MAG: hypothetical protein NT062_26285 [Proteobacteria bacterium]|nr:hypothetical protein [Pseudomonadota bacterium]
MAFDQEIDDVVGGTLATELDEHVRYIVQVMCRRGEESCHPPAISMDVDAHLIFGSWRVQHTARPGLGFVIDGLAGATPAPADYVNEILLAPAHREDFLALVDRVGLVVCKHVGGDDALHRDVRGRSSRGRLSQGEYFHHDGCTGPIPPRVVEIRCPYQEVERHTFTAIAPFPEVVDAMLLELPARLHTPEIAAAHAEVLADEPLSSDWDVVQGWINRAIRRALPAEEQRAYLRGVDARVGAYREPWEMGESRFIANANAGHTMQHRRAYVDAHEGKRPNGRLVKRWPAEANLVECDEACEL